jgi:hypothetical protein
MGLVSSEATRRAPEGEQMVGGSGSMLPRNFSKKYERLKMPPERTDQFTSDWRISLSPTAD